METFEDVFPSLLFHWWKPPPQDQTLWNFLAIACWNSEVS